MKRLLGCLVVVLLNAGVVSAQTWPDYYLTNGTHTTISGVEDYGALVVGEDSHNNRLTISDGGVVNSSYGGIGLQDPADHNQVSVTGTDSQWNISGGLLVGNNRAKYNRVTISDGGVVNSSGATIGGHRGSNYNSVEVSGVGSQWNNSSDLVIGDNSGGNSLVISDGGVVSTSNTWLGIWGSYSPWHNSIRVEGTDSKWINSGTFSIAAEDNLLYNSVSNSLSISDGGEAVLQGGIIVHQNYGLVNINQGGRLTVGTDFDASMGGFSFNSGSTLAVQGQLSGLSTLETGRRLEAPNVLGDLTAHGTFAPGNSPADSIVDGLLTIAADGTLEMELGGHILGEEYDRLTVTDTAYLDGTLDIVLLDGFSVAYGDSFDLFNWDGGVNGEFESISTSALSGGLYWDTSSLYTTGTLSVIPEPESAVMIAMIGGCGWFVRRRFMI